MSQAVYKRLPGVKVLKQTSDRLYTANGTNLTVIGTHNIQMLIRIMETPERK